MCRMAHILKSDDDDVRIKFMFEIFADFQVRMKKKPLVDYCEIFNVPYEDFETDTPNTEEFYVVVEEYECYWELIYACRPMLCAMTCLQPETDLEEKNAILAAVNDNPNIESYIIDNFM